MTGYEIIRGLVICYSRAPVKPFMEEKMKRLGMILFMLLIGAVGFAVADDSLLYDFTKYKTTIRETERGEGIWKITENLLLEAMMDASVKNIDRWKDRIVIWNDFDQKLDDGIVTFNPKDPDYLRIAQKLIVPDFLPDPEDCGNQTFVSTPVPEPTPFQPVNTTPVPEAPDSENTFVGSQLVAGNGSDMLDTNAAMLDNLGGGLKELKNMINEMGLRVAEFEGEEQGFFEQVFNDEKSLVGITIFSTLIILICVFVAIRKIKR